MFLAKEEGAQTEGVCRGILCLARDNCCQRRSRILSDPMEFVVPGIQNSSDTILQQSELVAQSKQVATPRLRLKVGSRQEAHPGLGVSSSLINP